MRIFFDVDYTILSSDYKLRTGTRETFERLIGDGHEVHVWSGEGKRWGVVRDHELGDLVTSVNAKPLRDYVRGLDRLEVSHVPDFVIDDYPEIVQVFGGFYAREFYSSIHDDDEMDHIYEVITEFVTHGTSDHPRWRPRSAETDRLLSKRA